MVDLSPQAQAMLDAFDNDAACDTIRRALERLQELEGQVHD